MGLPPWLRGSKIHLQFRRHNGFHPWAGKIPWRRAWPPLRDSCLENPVDRGAAWAAVPGVAQRHSWRLTRTHTILTHTQSKIFKWRISGTTWRLTSFHSFIVLFRHKPCSCPHFVPWVITPESLRALLLDQICRDPQIGASSCLLASLAQL